MTGRAEWRSAVARAARVTRLDRSVLGTLCQLGERMADDGTLAMWRRDMVEVTGLGSTAINHHLGHAVEHGWLVRATRGGHGRPSVYIGAIREESNTPNHEKGPPYDPRSRTQLGGAVRPRVALANAVPPSSCCHIRHQTRETGVWRGYRRDDIDQRATRNEPRSVPHR